MKVLAVVATHNRANLLHRCLKHNNEQVIVPNSILVVNNGSNDNTSEVIKNHNAIELLQENLGSAGGWYSGIDYCIKNNFDACWLMDDDGYPHRLALSTLIQEMDKSHACISSCVLKESNNDEFVFPLPKLNSNQLPLLFSFKRKYFRLSEMRKHGLSEYNFAHLFNGALISSNAILSIGNINKDYFIMGDEVDYFFRLKSVGSVKTVFDAKHFHPDVSKREYTETKIYYLLKNTIINHNKYFDARFLRNAILILIVSIRVSFRNGILFFLKLLFSRSLIIPKAIYRGYKNRLGSDIRI